MIVHETEPRPGIDPASLDTSVSPTEDFYRYANGMWIQNNPIPADLPRWGRFNALAESNLKLLNDILEQKMILSAPPGSIDQKLGDFYASGMDTEAIEAAGLQPLQEEFDRIAAIQTLRDLQSVTAHMQRGGVNVLFGFGSTQDAKDTTRVIAEVGQGGLGLPDRDYYIKDDERSKLIRTAYVDHVTRMFVHTGDDEGTAAAHASTVMAFETKLAEASKTRVELRDPQANYNMRDAAGLKLMMPHWSWDQYFTDCGRSDLSELNVGQPKFFEALDRLVTETPIEDVKTYLRWHLVKNLARYLSSKFVDENFNFQGRVLTGAEVIRPRWKRVVDEVDHSLGELLGQAYVESTFSPAAKAHVREMVANLQDALREDIATLPWMGEETRTQAIAKMDAFTDKIGYPDKWKDYSKLDVDRGPYVLNVLRARHWAHNEDVDKIGKPVDRGEWHMTPSTVNAYYNPLMNEIVFPAGILQPPFFDARADDAVNYGAIGAVIGHEMTHGFDDQGSQFDPQGNLRNWWTEEDLKNFHERATAIENQFSRYEVEPGLHINGELVKGESIADLGGLSLAWRAFKKSQEGKPEAEPIDGFTADQRFFLGFATVWAGDARPEYVRLQVQTDPHPHARYRVIGTLSNMPEFAAAFGAGPGDPMVLPADQRTQIW